MKNQWYVIVNPASGNGTAKKKWGCISSLLTKYNLQYTYDFTTDASHGNILVQKAIVQGFTKIISVGGDGTLHNIVNGIMSQKIVPTSKIAVGVIPVGTGNDWIKTYAIPKNIEKSIQIIANEKTQNQDVGLLKLFKTNNTVYFNNLAGLGFDGYIVHKTDKLKNLGTLSYLIGAILGVATYKKSILKVQFNEHEITTKSLMTLIGICKYSGGGMQLTKDPYPTDGLFDVSIMKNVTLMDLLRNILNLFNGKIVHHKKVVCYKSTTVSVSIENGPQPYIQADGELIGQGGFEVQLIPKAITVIVP